MEKRKEGRDVPTGTTALEAMWREIRDFAFNKVYRVSLDQARLLFRISFLCLVFRRAHAHNLPVLAERSPALANYQEQLMLVCRTPSGFVVGGGGRAKGRGPGRSEVEDYWFGLL